MNHRHPIANPTITSQQSVPTAASVAAQEGLQLSCWSEVSHINRSEFELMSAGETGVLSYALRPNAPAGQGTETK